MSIGPFRLELEPPAGAVPWLAAIEDSIAAHGIDAVRWAIVEARAGVLVIEGACWCSPSST